MKVKTAQMTEALVIGQLSGWKRKEGRKQYKDWLPVFRVTQCIAIYCKKTCWATKLLVNSNLLFEQCSSVVYFIIVMTIYIITVPVKTFQSCNSK